LFRHNDDIRGFRTESFATLNGRRGSWRLNDHAAMDDAAKKDLDTVVATTSSLDGYVIEISGYASASGPSELNQKLSEERAAAITRYLEEVKNMN
jgi:outer membrane protein OmpA-like peptidoglycan-associated protein